MDSLQKDQMQKAMEVSCALKKEIHEATALLLERQIRLLNEAEVYLYKQGPSLDEDTESLRKGLDEISEIEARINLLQESCIQNKHILESGKKN